jgi:periplasmic divalent cation tolerance protein
MLKNNQYIVVFITASSDKEADFLREKLLENKLAACVNKTNINSMFCWKGNVEKADEVMLIVKTKQALFEKLEALVRGNHSYEVPEIIALPIISGSKPYLDWINETTG